MLSRDQLLRAAGESGFQAESFEKAHVLVRLLAAVRAHPFLGTRLALKGGTALNLFVLPLPRLSVDIDLNYVGASDRGTMLTERPRVDQALEQVAGREGFSVRRMPGEHAGGKWRLAYTSALGRPGSIEIDVNFMLRSPLWGAAPRDSHLIGGDRAHEILVLDEHELAAGKFAALVARSASRDLFDARELLRLERLDPVKLRLGFVVYGAANRVDWRSITMERIQTSSADVEAQLVPMLRLDVRPANADVRAWTETLVRETRALMSVVLPLAEQEREFLERLNGAGEIVPELLTSEPAMQQAILVHPALAWKAFNVRHLRDAEAGENEPPI